MYVLGSSSCIDLNDLLCFSIVPPADSIIVRTINTDGRVIPGVTKNIFPLNNSWRFGLDNTLCTLQITFWSTETSSTV